MINLELFNEKYQEAVSHLDDRIAKELLKEMEAFITAKNIKKEYPRMYEKFQRAIINLKLVALPKLSDEESVEIIKSHFLEALSANIDIENRLTLKLFLIPYIPRDELREKMKIALMQNNQILGDLPVSQWIQIFEKEYDIKNRNLSASSEFINKNKTAEKIDPVSKEHLKELLYLYDYLLVTTLPMTEPELSNYLNSSYAGKNQSGQTDSFDVSANQASPNIIQETLSDAIKKYPEAGEQIITSQKIELKHFHEPVRPSIKNWLADYISLLGYEEHDAIERSNYLFHTTNTRQLLTADRERLAYILKAFDEKNPIGIDTARKQIIFNFPPKNPIKAPQASSTLKLPAKPFIKKETESVPPQTFSVSPDNRPLGQEKQKPSFKNQPALPNAYETYSIKKMEPKQELSAGKIFSAKVDGNIQKTGFDFPQKMAFEKEQEKKKEPPKDILQPYRITSSAFRRNNEQKQAINPNNVIDLKNPQQ